jgi:hypothetical protein
MCLPGLRRVLGIGQIGAADVAAMIAGGVLPYLANSALGSTSTRRKLGYQAPDFGEIAQATARVSAEDLAEENVNPSKTTRAVAARPTAVAASSRRVASPRQRQMRGRQGRPPR